MADLTAANVTVTIQKKGRIPGFGRITRASLAFGDGALTIPAGGLIPLPVATKFGVNTFYGMFPIGGTGGYICKYVAASHSLLVLHADYDAGADGALIAAAAVAIAAQVLPVVVFGK